MKPGDTRWRLLDEDRTVALLEYLDGNTWRPMPKPRRLEVYPSRLVAPGSIGVEVPQGLADELDKLLPPGGYRYVLYSK